MTKKKIVMTLGTFVLLTASSAHAASTSDVIALPEPTTLALLGLGAVLVAARVAVQRRRQSRRARSKR